MIEMLRYTRRSFHFDVSVNKCYYYYPTRGRAASAGERCHRGAPGRGRPAGGSGAGTAARRIAGRRGRGSSE